MARFLMGKDYPKLCDECKKAIDAAVQICQVMRDYGPDEEFNDEAS